jgi:hypothetical protein
MDGLTGPPWIYTPPWFLIGVLLAWAEPVLLPVCCGVEVWLLYNLFKAKDSRV